MILSRKNIRNAFFVLMCVITPLCSAEIYKWTDKNGKVHYGERKPGNSSAEAVNLKAVNSSKAQKIYQRSSTTSSGNASSEKKTSTTQSLFPKSEQECAAEYNLSCDQVFNWEKYAMKACQKARYADCDNSSFLARKFKPVTIRQRQITNRAKRARAQRVNRPVVNPN